MNLHSVFIITAEIADCSIVVHSRHVRSATLVCVCVCVCVCLCVQDPAGELPGPDQAAAVSSPEGWYSSSVAWETGR